ncbi:MAG: PKD domain-containing protein, partial [Saprospiraceae bacterium]|nr:PKD domain-containing protein [Saprospiraceae bacterium]
MDMEVLGLASSYFGVDQQGILDGMVWEIINSGQVSYEYSGFFHGLLRFNFDPAIAVPWHASFNPLDLPMNNEFDLYSVAYHEAFHMLGFASFLVNSDNGNFAPPATMAFNRYDRFLTAEPGGVPLILNNNPPGFDWSLNPVIVVNDLYNSCDDPLTNPDVCFSSGGVCYPVFTGDPGSPNAFSHLNIDCDGVASAEFLMNPTLPNGVRRTPTIEEWEILCALGYTLSVGETNCGCDLAAADDRGPDCEDGFSIPFCQCLEFSKADLLANDSPNAIDLVIQANNPFTGQLTQTGDNFLYCPNRPGLHTLKYFPIGCGGQEGNTAFVFIEALADSDLCPELLECNTPLPACDDLMGFQHCHQSPPCEFPGPGCDQFCNGHICGTVYSNSTLPAGLLDYPYFPAGNSLSTANSKAVVPNWYRSHGSPDLFLTGGSPGIRISGGGGLNDPADGFTEGVFSMADFGEGPYLLGFAFDPAGFAPNLLRVSAIHGGNLTPVPWEQSQAVADYNGVGPVEVLDLTYFTNMPASRAGACFEVDDSAYDALWFWVDPVFGETNSPVQLSDVELMPDDFSAGDDVVSPMCGDPVILGGRFCMLTGLEVTYTWLENGQPIAQYSVLNDQATVLFGNIDPQDHTLTIFPASTTSFVLTREITDFGLYDPDIEFCTIDDKVNVEVSVATPTPGFTYQIEDCQTIVAFQATPDSDPGAVYSWDFGDGSTSSLSSPTHQYLDFGPFTVTLIVENSCGMASYSEEILLSPCLQDCTCEGQFFGDFIGNTLLSQTSLPAQASNGILQMGGGCLQIGGIFVIDQDFEFSNGEIFMLPGAEIRVPAQRVLKFTGMHVHGCDALWHTIKVANGAEFWTNEGTLIEDGLYAVSAYNNAGLRINYTDFNRNFLSIFLTGGAHFLFDQEFKGNQFDCTAPLLPSFTGSHLLPFGNELPPIGNWAYTGMWIRNSNQLIDLGSVYVFPQNLNEFRRLANGVVADDFNLLHIRQTRFYDMKENSPYPITGYGVRAEGNGAETLRFEGLGLESAPEPPLALTGTILPTIEKAAVGVFTTGVNLEIE